MYADLARAQAVEESRKRFQQATAPKPTYRDAAGGEHKVDPAAPSVQTLRKTVTPDRYANRPARAKEFYGRRPESAPPVVYRDPFGPMFYFWLLERASAGRRAEWAYHHRSQIDEARWADMTRRDPQLESRVKQLEAAGPRRDPSYAPPELAKDRDLMYSDEYLAAVWNPQPQQAAEPPNPGQPRASEPSAAGGPPAQATHRRTGFPWTAIFAILALVGLGAFVLWLFFSRRLQRSAVKPPKETASYNPLSAQCGSFVTIDELDFRGKNYRVAEIQQYEHQLGGKRFPLVNYVLQSGDEVVRLRAIPFEDRWKALLLTLYDEMAYDEGLHNVVRDDTLKFVVDDAEAGLHEEYWRVEDVRDSYKARVTIHRGESKDAPPQVSHAQLEYWDYWRDTEVDGVKVTQYLYVEMNRDTGWFQIWRGTETGPEGIMVI